jgi:chemotaxis signal transduction protein
MTHGRDERDRASDLRAAFDRDFSIAARPSETTLGDFLCIQVAGEPSAIAVAEIASLHADLAIAELPARAPELLGVAAIRGAIVPIYDLARLLGFSGPATMRWTVLAGGGAVGFAFEAYDGHARIDQRAIAAAAQGGHVRGQLVMNGQPRSIIDLGSVGAAIATRWRRPGAAKEP